jgi:hypothetical protein
MQANDGIKKAIAENACKKQVRSYYRANDQACSSHYPCDNKNSKNYNNKKSYSPVNRSHIL